MFGKTLCPPHDATPDRQSGTVEGRCGGALTHEEAKGDGQHRPALWQQIGLSRFPQRSRSMWLDEPVDEDDGDD